eukprot:4080685-Amphidinium_carterae.1
MEEEVPLVLDEVTASCEGFHFVSSIIMLVFRGGRGVRRGHGAPRPNGGHCMMMRAHAVCFKLVEQSS